MTSETATPSHRPLNWYTQTDSDVIIRLEARLQPNMGFTLSPVHTSNNVEATLSKQQATKQQATLLPIASTMLPFWATMSQQRSTLSKGRNFNAKLVRHCCRFWQQSQTLLRHCCWCGPGFTVRFGGVHTFGYNSDESESIWMKSGAL